MDGGADAGAGDITSESSATASAVHEAPSNPQSGAGDAPAPGDVAQVTTANGISSSESANQRTPEHATTDIVTATGQQSEAESSQPIEPAATAVHSADHPEASEGATAQTTPPVVPLPDAAALAKAVPVDTSPSYEASVEHQTPPTSKVTTEAAAEPQVAPADVVTAPVDIVPELPEGSKSQLKHVLTHELRIQLASVTTPHGVTLEQCMQSALANPDADIGVFAGDAESYALFDSVMRPVIARLHDAFAQSGTHPPRAAGYQFPSLDDRRISSIRMTISRNIEVKLSMLPELGLIIHVFA